MTLTSLTTSGWLWFALTLVVDVTFLTQAALALRHKDRDITVWPYAPALMTAWLLWLVTP